MAREIASSNVYYGIEVGRVAPSVVVDSLVKLFNQPLSSIHSDNLTSLQRQASIGSYIVLQLEALETSFACIY